MRRLLSNCYGCKNDDLSRVKIGLETQNGRWVIDKVVWDRYVKKFQVKYPLAITRIKTSINK